MCVSEEILSAGHGATKSALTHINKSARTGVKKETFNTVQLQNKGESCRSIRMTGKCMHGSCRYSQRGRGKYNPENPYKENTALSFPLYSSADLPRGRTSLSGREVDGEMLH